MTSVSPPRAILLDFDGTLVDSEPLHYRCWAEAVRPWGVTTDWDVYRARFVGITDREAGRMLLSENGHDATEELVSAACEAKHRLYRARCGEELSISEETAHLIRQLMTKVPLAVVSSSIAVELAPILQKAGLNGSIRVVVTGDQVTRHKPDPEPYNLAVSRLKELDPFITASTCLVFEDSKAGIAAATAAGMRVSGVEHPSNLPAQIRREAAALLNNSSL